MDHSNKVAGKKRPLPEERSATPSNESAAPSKTLDSLPANAIKFETRVRLLCCLFQNGPPKKPESIPDNNMFNTEQVAWDTLCEIKEDPHKLTDSQLDKLFDLKWFNDFMLTALSRNNRRFFFPTHDEVISLLIQHCPLRQPLQSDPPVIAFRVNRPFLFKGSDALKSLEAAWNKRAGPSASAKRAFLDLPWGFDWERESAKPPPPATRVSTSAKVNLTAIFYPYQAPSWRDEIPVGVDDDVWLFKPVQWLDDICEAWLCDKSNVRISKEDMGRLEKLAWFTPWLNGLKAKRHRRMARAASEATPVEGADAGSNERREALLESFSDC